MSKFTDIWHKTKSVLGNFVRTRSLFTFFLFLLFATMLWYGHALNAVRERTMSVSIEYLGVPDNVAFETPLPAEFQFTVRDQGKRLRVYSSDYLVPLQIDLSSQIKGEKGTVHLSAEQVRPKITDQLQGTAKLQKVSPEQITSDYYKQASKKLPVKLSGELQCASQYSFTQTPQLSPAHVMVYGKKEQLDTLREVWTEEVVLQSVKDTLRSEVSLRPIEGVRFAQTEIQLTAVAERFTEKRFTLPVTPQGVPAGERLRIFPATVELTAQIYLSHFADVDEKAFRVVCNYPNVETATLPFRVVYSSPYIISARVNPTEAEYIIETVR